MSSKITINNINMIGMWKYNFKFNETCSICRNNLHEQSLYISDNKKSYVRTGQCFHTFHSVCIEKWFKTNKTCPLCTIPWNDKIE